MPSPAQSSFFLKAKPCRKNAYLGKKRNPGSSETKRKRGAKTQKIDGTEGSDIDIEANEIAPYDYEQNNVSSDDDIGENSQEKRIRLAKAYINSLAQNQDSDEDEFSDEELASGSTSIHKKLEDEALEAQGRLVVNIADKISPKILWKKDLRSPATCCIMDHDQKYIFVSCKRGPILKFSKNNGKLEEKFFYGNHAEFEGHTDQVLALECTSHLLFSAGKDKKICVWNISDNENVKLEYVFQNQHRDTITGLSIREPPSSVSQIYSSGASTSSNTILYSASLDRTIRLYNIDQMSYIETLFGHQDGISDIDVMVGVKKDRCVSVGQRDRTARVWKINEESQLVFRAPTASKKTKISGQFNDNKILQFFESSLNTEETGSLDTVSCLDEETFVSGSDGGTLSLWSIHRKKPIFSLPNAHGKTLTFEESETNGETHQKFFGSTTCYSRDIITRENIENEKWSMFELSKMISIAPNWISAVAARLNSDLIATGSCEGFIRFWKVDKSQFPRKSLQLVYSLDCCSQSGGWINSLRFSKCGGYLVASIGREPKCGRWQTFSGKKKSKNSLILIEVDCK